MNPYEINPGRKNCVTISGIQCHNIPYNTAFEMGRHMNIKAIFSSNAAESNTFSRSRKVHDCIAS